jgi:hypothetical protein
VIFVDRRMGLDLLVIELARNAIDDINRERGACRLLTSRCDGNSDSTRLKGFLIYPSPVCRSVSCLDAYGPPSRAV